MMEYDEVRDEYNKMLVRVSGAIIDFKKKTGIPIEDINIGRMDLCFVDTENKKRSILVDIDIVTKVFNKGILTEFK